MTDKDTINAVCAYLWHTDPTQIIRDIYGEVHADYGAEKIVLRATPVRFVGGLDDARLDRLIAAAR